MKFLYLPIILALLTSCERKINEKDIKVIEGIKLGLKYTDFNKYLDSLSIPRKDFLIEMEPQQFGLNTKKKKISTHISEIFNLVSYRSNTLKHYGFLQPVTEKTGTFVIGINVYLMNINSAKSTDEDSYDNQNNEGLISQDVSLNLINEINKMLSKKYGIPKDTVVNVETEFYVSEANKINKYFSKSPNFGKTLIWETEDVKISFFNGIESMSKEYVSEMKEYITLFNPKTQVENITTNSTCNSFAFINYQLKKNTMKKLNLDIDEKL